MRHPIYESFECLFKKINFITETGQTGKVTSELKPALASGS
jgi:hypothetical protein